MACRTSRSRPANKRRPGADIVCPGDVSSPNSCYLYRQDRQPWEVARDECVKLGGYLVAIETRSELSSIRQDVLISHYGMRTLPSMWVGLNDRSREGVYTWEGVGGTLPLSSSMWKPGQPYWVSAGKEDCIGFDGYRLQDGPCRAALRYICEFVL
ncbi:C-type lectin domain family 3 member A-like [Diadema antillarum]|uniref:C-type lectin domain family 3 member A-like n=1 Tax=Diadema antillarum TaxID=105358 RepID=UPI003A8A5C49